MLNNLKKLNDSVVVFLCDMVSEESLFLWCNTKSVARTAGWRSEHSSSVTFYKLFKKTA